MNLRNLFTLNAIVVGLFGLGFVLVPGPLIDLYDAELSDAGLYAARLLGAAYLAFAVLSWQSRDAQDSTARQAIVLSMFVGVVVGLIVALVGQLNNVLNSLGWINVAIYLLFAIGYGYFQFRPSETG